MDEEGNAFVMKKLGHLIVFKQHEAEYFRFMFLSILTLLSKTVNWVLPQHLL